MKQFLTFIYNSVKKYKLPRNGFNKRCVRLYT